MTGPDRAARAAWSVHGDRAPDRARSPPGRRSGHAGSVVGPMDLSATDDVIDGTPVLSLLGEADLATLPTLLERVNRFVAEHPGHRVLLDLDGLGSMAPVAVGVLVGAPADPPRQRRRPRSGVHPAPTPARVDDLTRSWGWGEVAGSADG